MQLSVELSEDIRDLVVSGEVDTLRDIALESETLAGAMNLACIEKDLLKTLAVKHLFFRLLDEWNHLLMFQATRQAIKHRGLWSMPSSMKAEPQHWEIVPTPLQNQIAGLEWLGVERRFEASLRASGFGDTLSKALCGAFHEMADNALSHSGPSVQQSAFGAVGYCVSEGWMTFCIGDVGRGVMASLKTNRANSSLRTDQEALRAAVINQATSKAQNQLGDGFQVVHRSLADQNGRLRFRSGNSVLLLDGRGHDRMVISRDAMLQVAGFQVAVHCVLDGVANDAEL